MNLWDELMGAGGEPPPAPKGSPIRCTCGRRVGIETDGGVWAAAYDHTPAAAALIVYDIATDDFEALAENGDPDTWVLIDFLKLARADSQGARMSSLAEVLPRLRVPAREVPRGALALDAARGDYQRTGRAGGRRALAGCGTCRTVYDVREALAAGERSRRGDLIATRPVSIASNAYGPPSQALPQRVEMYRRLNVVLSLRHSAS